MEIHEKFRRIREEGGYTQEQFAEVIHVDTSAVSRIEKGERKIAVDELIALAGFIKEDVTFFFTYPKRYVDESLLKSPERISVTFEVSPDKRDILLKLVTGQDATGL